MNGDPVPDQYYNPVTATLREDESAITIIASSHPEYFLCVYFFFILFTETSRTRSHPCIDGRRAKETVKRVVSDGNREACLPPFAIELSAGRFVDRKDIAHVTGGAINSRYIPAIVDAFCHRSSHRTRLLFTPRRRG